MADFMSGIESSLDGVELHEAGIPNRRRDGWLSALLNAGDPPFDGAAGRVSGSERRAPRLTDLISRGQTGVPQGEDIPLARDAGNPTGGNPKDRLVDRIVDDPASRHSQGQPQSGDFVDQAPQMAQASRASLIDQVRQPSQPDPLQSQYDEVGKQLAQPPKKRSLWKDMLAGALAGPGAGAAIRTRQQGQEFQQNQLRERQASLLSQIEARQRMQQEQDRLNQSEDFQERMANNRALEQERNAAP